MKGRLISFVLGIAISVMTADAHHSIAGAYDSKQRVTIEGIIAQFQFVNPHPFVTMDVTQAGSTQHWRIEMDNRSELAQVGMTGETLKHGDRIVVTGNPAYSQAQSLYVIRLDRPSDGFRYEQVGSSPRISVPK